jgi:hypothetical protein
MQVRVARSGGQFESRRSRIAIWGCCGTHDAPHSNSAPRTVQRSAFRLQSSILSTRAAELGGIERSMTTRSSPSPVLSPRGRPSTKLSERSRQKPFVLRLSKYERRTLNAVQFTVEFAGHTLVSGFRIDLITRTGLSRPRGANRGWNMRELFTHVICRGNQRQVIFRSDADRKYSGASGRVPPALRI